MNWKDSPPLDSEARRRFIDLVIVGILPRNLPQYAVPDCPIDLALRMTADETLPWEVPDEFLKRSDDNADRTEN